MKLAIAITLMAASALQAQRVPLDAVELSRLREEEPRRARLAAEQVNRARFGLGEAHSFEPAGAFTDHYGRLHARFRQLYKGVRVVGASVIAHVDEQDRFLDPTVRIFADIEMEATPALDAAAARGAILAQLRQENSILPEPPVQLQLAIAPERALVFTEDPSKRVVPAVPSIDEYQWVNRGYRLVWQAITSAGESATDVREPEAWIVDATTGAILRRYSLRADDAPRTAVNGTARTSFSGSVDFSISRNEETGLYELTDITRGGNTVTNLDGTASVQRAKAKPYTSTGSVWGDGRKYDASNGTTSANGQTPAVEAALIIERAWDYLRNVHGHSGLDGKGTPIEARVHFGGAVNDAFWHRTAGAAFFGSGAASATQNVTDPETVAHELGHGLWYAFHETEGGDDSEADAIAQGNADIFAALVEFYHLGARGRGAVLADVEAPWNWRARMVDPQRAVFRQADGGVQPGLAYWTADARLLDEHAVGTLYGHLFVLLARGASADRGSPLSSRYFPGGTTGLGLQAAANLWYVATTSLLPDEPTFFDVRNAYLQAAAFLYGGDSMQYAITANAFAAIGMGTPVADAAVPAVSSLSIQSLDEGEGSMLVNSAATDDTGVLKVEYVVGGQTLLSRTRAPYSGYVDISRLVPGNYTLLARAIDASAKVGLASAPFAIKGVNQLIADGGFEGGGGRWTASPSVMRTGAAESFLGERHAAFSASGFLAQQVSIGANATSAELSLRLRVENDGVPNGSRLEIQVRDTAGNLLETLATVFDNADTRDELANQYQRRTFSLMAHRGRTVELRVVGTIPAGGASRFRVDAVSLVSVEPAGGEGAAEVDEGEAAVVLRLRNVTGIRPAQVSRVDFVVNGETAATVSAEPYVAVLPSNPLARRTSTMTAVIYDLGGAKLFETAPVAFTVREVSQLILNGSFELGGANWTTVGQTSFARDADPAAPNPRAFLGARYALLGGRGAAQSYELSQPVAIPAEAASATLSFRLRVDAAERANDTLTVRVFERDGGRDVTVLGTFTSQLNTKGPDSARGYVKRTFDVSRYAGREILVQLQAREDTGTPTSFLVDAVSLVWK